MEIKDIIAMRICILRIKRKLTREQLARKCGINESVIVLAESCTKHISIETLNKILNALEISLWDFIGENVFKSWTTKTPWKEYFYINMNRSVYTYCDQPTTCPLCGGRTDIIFEYDVLRRYATINQCLDKKCWYIFMMEADWDEMREVIAIIKRRWKNPLTFENYI